MLDVVLSNRFKKDLKLAAKRGLDLDELEAIVNQLAAQQPLLDKTVTTPLQETILVSVSVTSARTGYSSTASMVRIWCFSSSAQAVIPIYLIRVSAGSLFRLSAFLRHFEILR